MELRWLRRAESIAAFARKNHHNFFNTAYWPIKLIPIITIIWSSYYDYCSYYAVQWQQQDPIQNNNHCINKYTVNDMLHCISQRHRRVTQATD